MTHVTEQALEEAKQALRAGFAEQLEALKSELAADIAGVSNQNAATLTLEDVRREVNNTPKTEVGVSTEDVRVMIEAAVAGLPEAPAPGLSAEETAALINEALANRPTPLETGVAREDVEQLISDIPPYDDGEINRRVLRLHAYSNGLADRIGAPRLEA